MKDQFVEKEGSAKNKHLTIAIIATVLASCLVLFAVSAMLFQKFAKVETTETSYADTAQYASSDEALQSSVKNYVSKYMGESEENAVISDEAAQEIIASITTGVLNSLPETMQNDEETVEYIRSMISTAVAEEIDANNEKLMSSEDYEVTTTASKDMLYYIDNVVVPMLTAELQMDAGEIEDLKETLASTSTTYVSNSKDYDEIIKNITDRLNAIKTQENINYDDEIAGLFSDLGQLEEILVQYRSASSTQITTTADELQQVQASMQDYMVELANRTENVEEYTETEIAALKELLNKKITEAADLSTTEINELQQIINDLEINSATDIESLRNQLEDAIASSNIEQSDALLEAVNNFNISLDEIRTTLLEQINNMGKLTDEELQKLKESLQGQIDANANLTAEQKKELYLAINSLDNSTATNIENVKKYLLQQLGDTNNTIISAVDGLNVDIDSIRNTIEANKKASDKRDDELQTYIDAVNQRIGTSGDSNLTIEEQLSIITAMLGDCEISYNENDGHFYITYKGGADSVTKKLDYVQ